MKIYKDRFAVGDTLVWRSQYWENVASARKTYGDGPFTVTFTSDVRDVRAVGHTQHLKVEGPDGIEFGSISGAFFRKR